MNEIKIRRARVRDISGIRGLGKTMEEFVCSPSVKFYSREELKEWIKKPKDNILLVAEINKKIEGFLYAKIMAREWCMIDNIGVKQDWRKKGIGKILLEELFKILKSKKVNFVQLFANLKHKKTINFWKNRKFNEGEKFLWLEKIIDV